MMMSPTQTVNAFFDAIMAKDVKAICDTYVPSPTTYVVLEGPRYTTLGYDKIALGWSDFCSSPLSLSSIQWVEGPFEEMSTDMAWVAGQIILTVQTNGKSFAVKFRATFVLRQGATQAWQIRHEHVSGPLPDPYGIGDWLKKNDPSP